MISNSRGNAWQKLADLWQLRSILNLLARVYSFGFPSWNFNKINIGLWSSLIATECFDFSFQVQLRLLSPRTYDQVNRFLPQAPRQVPRRMLLLRGLLVVCLSTPIKTRLTEQVSWQNRTTGLLTSVVYSAYALSVVLNFLKDLSLASLLGRCQQCHWGTVLSLNGV